MGEFHVKILQAFEAMANANFTLLICETQRATSFALRTSLESKLY